MQRQHDLKRLLFWLVVKLVKQKYEGWSEVYEREPWQIHQNVWCLKIAKKVAFNIARLASYVYILSGQKLINNAKNGQFLASFWKSEACGQTVLPDRSLSTGQKILLRHFE